MSRGKTLGMALLSFMLFFGCSKGDGQGVSAKTSDSQNDFMELEEGKKYETPKRDPKENTFPRADKNVPLSQYVLWNDDEPALYLLYALRNKNVDYEIAAKKVSAEYEREGDEFKRRDLMVALKPLIDSRILKAKSQRYFRFRQPLEIGNNGNYSFNKKGYYIGNDLSYWADKTSKTYWVYQNDPVEVGGNAKYALVDFTNYKDYRFIPVKDEAIARRMTAMKDKNPPMQIEYYAFAQGVLHDDQDILSAEIVKIRILDGAGNELVSY